MICIACNNELTKRQIRKGGTACSRKCVYKIWRQNALPQVLPVCFHCSKTLSEEQTIERNKFCSSSCAARSNLVGKPGHNKGKKNSNRKRLSGKIKSAPLLKVRMPKLPKPAKPKLPKPNPLELKIKIYLNRDTNNPPLINGSPRKGFLPRTCKACNTPYWAQRNPHYCSSKCCMSKQGGYQPHAGVKKAKRGYYKGFYCSSTWELAWLIYTMDHGIIPVRNTQSFPYTYHGKSLKYIPDFILPNNTYVEIKGSHDLMQWYEKLAAFPHIIKVYYETNLSPIFTYILKKYQVGRTKLEKLYHTKPLSVLLPTIAFLDFQI
jgi:hypothetical protein